MFGNTYSPAVRGPGCANKPCRQSLRTCFLDGWLVEPNATGKLKRCEGLEFVLIKLFASLHIEAVQIQIAPQQFSDNFHLK